MEKFQALAWLGLIILGISFALFRFALTWRLNRIISLLERIVQALERSDDSRKLVDMWIGRLKTRQK